MDTFRQALRHAEATFRLSVAFMAGGAAIILAGGILALIHAGNPDLSYLPIITSLTGALITGGGGALAIHANRARKHLTEQGERLDAQIAEDHKVERLRGWIDRVVNPETRDQLNTTAAIKDMGLDPDPAAITDRVLPETQRVSGEIEASRPDAGAPGQP
ncbi:TRADD-N-associated membrane domain-containing protein [Streptomyces coeruleorubidus]|uniref:TRADD-N-associated membrane domain-containing protein n=1 Tax=Streptomyces coeruleorubidus TaxID=116188 RepID=UPI0036BBF324